MDLRDLIKKIDSIENPETGQKKRIDEGAPLSTTVILLKIQRNGTT